LQDTQCDTVKHFDLGTGTRATASDDVDAAIAIHVSGRDTHAAEESSVVGEEAGQFAAVPTVEDFDVWPSTRSCSSDDVVPAIAIDVVCRDIDAAEKLGAVGEEALQFPAVNAVEDFDPRCLACSGSGDDVERAVAVDVTRGDSDSATERGILGQEAELFGSVRRKDADERFLTVVERDDH
jgi:hypothetical protein